MLTYLASSTWPEFAFAVHQSAKFTTAPHCTHELAIHQIVRYHKGTSTHGYVFMSFLWSQSGLLHGCWFWWHWEFFHTDDPSSVKSRTSYDITSASCTVLFFSKIQTDIALSTTEAEYITLSKSAHDLIPLRGLLQEFSDTTKLILDRPLPIP
jgi:hypothetical protein